MAKKSETAADAKNKSQSTNKRDLVNGAISALLVPMLDDLMKRIAAQIPEDSVAHNPTLLRIADGVLGYLEGQTDKLGLVWGSLAEKGVNAAETLTMLLSGKIEVEKHEKTGFEVKFEPIAAAAQKKILGAKDKNEVAKILIQLEAQLDGMMQFAEMAKKKTTPPPKPKPEILEHDAFFKIVDDAAGKGAVHLRTLAARIRRS